MPGGATMPALRWAVRRVVPARARPALRRHVLPLLQRYRDQFSAPVVSVVVTARGGGDYVNECLASLRQQTQRRVEVIVVDDGAFSGSVEATRRLPRRYPRVRVVRTEPRGIGAARNLGAQYACGRYLGFVDANDTLPSDALRILVRSLERSGSDFAVGAVHRVRVGRSSRLPHLNQVHELDRVAVTIDEYPTAMQDVGPFNRLYRRAFWAEQVGGFVQGTSYGENLASVTAYLRANTFDMLKAVTYRWHLRTDPRSIVAGRARHEELSDHVAMLERTRQLVSSEASPHVAASWLAGVLDSQLAPYIDGAGRADDLYRQHLSRAARTFVDGADHHVWAHVRLHQRLRVWLTSRAQWRGLELCTEFFRLNGPIPVTRVLDGRVYAEPPSLPELDELPGDLLELPRRQTELSACIAHARWQDETFVLDGWAFIRGVDLTGVAPSIEAWLLDSESGERVQVTLEARTAVEADRWANQRHQAVESSGFRAYLDTRQLPDLDPAVRDRLWQLQVRVSAHGLQRTGGVRSVLLNGIGHRMPARELRNAQDPVRVVPLMQPRLGFCLQQRSELVRASDLYVGAGGQVGGRLRILGALPAPLARVRATSAAGRVEVPLVADRDGYTFALDLPTTSTPVSWTFLAVGEQGERHRVAWPVEAQTGRALGAGRGGRWSRSPRGYCDLTTGFTAVQVSRVTGSESALTVEATLVGLTADDLAEAVLTSSRAIVGVHTVEQLAAQRVRLEFPLLAAVWVGPERPLPPASYRLMLPSRDLRFSPSDDLLADLPIEATTGTHGMTVERSPSHMDLVVSVRAPLADDERGRLAQHRLAQWYNDTDFTPTDSVLLQCYRGEFATDSQRAIHDELRRQQPGLPLLWGVSDYSVELPVGAVPLLIGSRAWYAAVGSSRYLCQNIDFDRFFRRRPYQRYLQTFHGYPFKSMGISLWRAQGKAESVIDAECERRNSAWDALLVPSDSCVAMYRSEYRYQGEILVTGYPRNDSLMSPDAALVRERVRQGLGISADTTVVLYAPTWRDTAATGAWTAKLFDELNLDRLAEQLGDRYAVLLRGHNYNLRDGGTDNSAAVLDVTSYPEINDLILAADVAVLDYSSLRFDWLITEKPVLFFVPDLDDYLSARTVLFDYRSSAPGPLLVSTAEVVTALRDLPAVSTEYAAARRAFNATFNGLHDGKAAKRVVEAFFADKVTHG